MNRAKATCTRKILSPPAVEPEQAPSASKMMKMMLVSGPQVPKSPRPKPVVVSTETMLKLLMRRASMKP
ncbi:hypothetical protein D3C84_1020560 [compost metagenome]